MKAKECFLISQDCGLTKVGEAIFNIQLRSMSIFDYKEEHREMKELSDDVKKYGFKDDDLISDCLVKIQESRY